MDASPTQEWVWVPFEVDKKFDGWRLDQFLTQRLTGYSRSKIQKILADARVHKAGRPAKSHGRVKNGDKVEVAYLRRPEAPLAAEASLPVLYEDEDLLIVNKPSDLLSHPTDKVVRHTVLGVLRHSRPDLKSVHLLHRLDRETSGVLALGKNPATARAWTQAMNRHEIQKEYLALVRGIPTPKEGVLDRPIGNQGSDIRVRQWIDVPGAVKALTRYQVLRTFAVSGPPPYSVALVRARPQTGRLHQIRVHLAALGTPLLGDPLYTGDGALYRKMLKGALTEFDRMVNVKFPRVALHAAALTFKHPKTGEPFSVQAPLAEDMTTFLRGLEINSD